VRAPRRPPPRGRQPDHVVGARRERLLEVVLARGDVPVEDLVAELGVSLMTVHRDLDALAARQLVRKVRGRALAPSTLTVETGMRFRKRAAVREKAAIAGLVADEIRGGITVMIDDSTSCLPLADALARHEDVTLVTNSVELARAAGAADGVDVVLLGGHYRADFDATFGADTTAALRGLRADVACISTPALHEGVLYHPIQESTDVKRAMLAASARHVLLVDASKFGRSAPYAFAHAADFDVVATDDAAPRDALDALRRGGVDLRVAAPGR